MRRAAMPDWDWDDWMIAKETSVGVRLWASARDVAAYGCRAQVECCRYAPNLVVAVVTMSGVLMGVLEVVSTRNRLGCLCQRTKSADVPSKYSACALHV